MPWSLRLPPASDRAFRVVRIVLGLFLLVAAALKAQGLALDPLSQDSFLSSPRLMVATIEVEVLLGLWLLSGWTQRVVWTCTFVFFTALAFVSLYMALVGQKSCGCLGQVAVNPWIMVGLDALAVIALAVFRPAGHAATAPCLWVRRASRVAIGAALLLLLTIGTFLTTVANPVETLAKLRGESVSIEPGVSQVGDGVAGEQRTFTIQLVNRTAQTIHVVGGSATCSCLTTHDLPLFIPPSEARAVEVQMTFQRNTGRFLHRYTLYTANESQPTIIARFSGRVIELTSP